MPVRESKRESGSVCEREQKRVTEQVLCKWCRGCERGRETERDRERQKERERRDCRRCLDFSTTRALHFCKRALYIRKSALHLRQRIKTHSDSFIVLLPPHMGETALATF